MWPNHNNQWEDAGQLWFWNPKRDVQFSRRVPSSEVLLFFRVFFFFSNFPVALILYLSIKKLIWHLFVKYISLLTSFQKPKDLQIYLIFMTRYHHKHATLPLFSVFIGSKRHQCCLTVWYGHHIDVVWYKVLILIRTVNQVLLAVWTRLMKLKWSF